MTLKPYPSRSKLCATARAEGLVVAHEDGKTVIDNGQTTVSFGVDTDITDASGRTLSGEDAFKALGLPLA